MQFQIPQFIEVEDKIFGPLTFRQFIYLIGGAGCAYMVWRVLPFFLAIPIIAGVGSLAAALAFFKYNGRPFILALEYGFSYLMHPKLYLWNNERRRTVARATKAVDEPGKSAVYIPKLSDSRLHELSWSLDIKERVAAGIGDDEEEHRVAPPVATISTMRSALPR